MTCHGQGHCSTNYLRGWDGLGVDSAEACNQVCENEGDCTFASFKKDSSCSRYHGSECALNVDTEDARIYATFKKSIGTDKKI